MLDQRLENAPNLMVDVGDASVVADLLLADEFRVTGTGAGIKDHTAFFEHRLVIPIAAHGRAKVFVLVKVKVRLFFMQCCSSLKTPGGTVPFGTSGPERWLRGRAASGARRTLSRDSRTGRL